MSGAFDPSQGVAAAGSLCDQEATDAGMGSRTWKPLLVTSDTTIFDLLGAGKFVNMNLDLLATNSSELFAIGTGSTVDPDPQYSILHANGSQPGLGVATWVGDVNVTCSDWNSTLGSGRVGFPAKFRTYGSYFNRWGYGGVWPCNTPGPSVYCVQSTFETSAPTSSPTTGSPTPSPTVSKPHSTLFVTKGGFNPGLGVAAAADLCRNESGSGNWKAVLVTTNTSLSSLLGTSNIVNTKGQFLASDGTSFVVATANTSSWSSTYSILHADGMEPNVALTVWVGAELATCQDWTMSIYLFGGNVGFASRLNTFGTFFYHDSGTVVSCSTPAVSVYCIQSYPETESPTSSPTSSPTLAPSTSPTMSPSTSPTMSPTMSPSTSPTMSPTISPSTSPTMSPTKSPTSSPTSPTKSPTSSPTSPTKSPTASPTSPTKSPTTSPTSPTITPTTSPSPAPTASPSASPTVGLPYYRLFVTRGMFNATSGVVAANALCNSEGAALAGGSMFSALLVTSGSDIASVISSLATSSVVNSKGQLLASNGTTLGAMTGVPAYSILFADGEEPGEAVPAWIGKPGSTCDQWSSPTGNSYVGYPRRGSQFGSFFSRANNLPWPCAPAAVTPGLYCVDTAPLAATKSPTTSAPTQSPVTSAPTAVGTTMSPTTTKSPTKNPTSKSPTKAPNKAPTRASSASTLFLGFFFAGLQVFAFVI